MQTIRPLKFFILHQNIRSGNASHFCNTLHNMLSSSNPSEMLVLGGDANIDLFIDSMVVDEWDNVLYSNGVVPHIIFPTRVTQLS